MSVRNWRLGESSPAQPQMNCSGDAERRAEEENWRREPLAVQWQQTAAQVGGERGEERRWWRGGSGGRGGAKSERRTAKPALGNGHPKFTLFQKSGSDERERRLGGCDLGVTLQLQRWPVASSCGLPSGSVCKEGTCKGHKVIWVLPE